MGFQNLKINIPPSTSWTCEQFQQSTVSGMHLETRKVSVGRKLRSKMIDFVTDVYSVSRGEYCRIHIESLRNSCNIFILYQVSY